MCGVLTLYLVDTTPVERRAVMWKDCLFYAAIIYICLWIFDGAAMWHCATKANLNGNTWTYNNYTCSIKE